MMLLKNLKNTKLFCFNNIKILPIFLFIVLISQTFNTKTIINTNKSISNYELTFTYYYPNDATGSGNTTMSGLGTKDFTADENGWYHYNYNGTDYLVVAAALKKCRDSDTHCGIDVNKHGIATTVPYYELYDTLTLQIGPKVYNAIVLDACGACMWGRQDGLGEKIDIYVNGSNAVNPGIYNSTSQNLGTSGSVSLGGYDTSYTGEIEKGYIYKTQINNAIKTTDADRIESNINNIINDIFKKANTYYDGNYDSNYEIITSNNDTNNWKQYDSTWGHIRLGNSTSTIKSAGCLVTSVAIQIKNSNTKLNTENFNPGTFVNYLNGHNGFQRDLFIWGNTWLGLAPNFQFVSKDALPSSKDGKIQKIKSLLSQGYYPVMCVKKNCGHWVAVTGATDDNIIISDPGSTSNTVWPKYNAILYDSSLKVAYFRKLD